MSNEYVPTKYQDPGFEKARQESRELNTSIFDSRIAEGLNRSAAGGAVQGTANPGNLSARAYAIMSSQKAQSIAQDMANIRQSELRYKEAYNLNNQQGEIQHNLQKPNAWNFVTEGLNLATNAVPVAGALGLFGKTFQDNLKPPGTGGFTFPINFQSSITQPTAGQQLSARGITTPGLSMSNPGNKTRFSSGNLIDFGNTGGKTVQFNMVPPKFGKWR